MDPWRGALLTESKVPTERSSARKKASAGLYH